MIAIIPAAGIGARLGTLGSKQPKRQLSFGGVTLLQRHIEVLNNLNVERILVIVGYLADQFKAEINRVKSKAPVELVFNPEYQLIPGKEFIVK